jgi:FxLD family lantipeptide
MHYRQAVAAERVVFVTGVGPTPIFSASVTSIPTALDRSRGGHQERKQMMTVDIALEDAIDLFELDLQIETDRVLPANAACTTNDTCLGTCASACVSRN